MNRKFTEKYKWWKRKNKNPGLISFIIQEIIKTIRFFSTLDWQKLKCDNT